MVKRWRIVYTKQAQKDARKIAATGLKERAERLLRILSENPYQTPPPYEKLIGDLLGAYRAGSVFSTALFTRSWRRSER